MDDTVLGLASTTPLASNDDRGTQKGTAKAFAASCSANRCNGPAYDCSGSMKQPTSKNPVDSATDLHLCSYSGGLSRQHRKWSRHVRKCHMKQCNWLCNFEVPRGFFDGTKSARRIKAKRTEVLCKLMACQPENRSLNSSHHRKARTFRPSRIPALALGKRFR